MNADQLLALATRLRERTLTSADIPELGDAVIHVRELNALERWDTLQAAAEGDEFRVNVTRWRLLAAPLAIFDPASDPANRQPLLRGEAAASFIARGNELAAKIGAAILDFAEATPESLKSGGAADDGAGDQAAGAGA